MCCIMHLIAIKNYFLKQPQKLQKNQNSFHQDVTLSL